MQTLITQMDWPLLQQQKQWLVSQSQYSELAQGLVHLLDQIQDLAVQQGLPEQLVMGVGHECR